MKHYWLILKKGRSCSICLTLSSCYSGNYFNKLKNAPRFKALQRAFKYVCLHLCSYLSEPWLFSNAESLKNISLPTFFAKLENSTYTSNIQQFPAEMTTNCIKHQKLLFLFTQIMIKSADYALIKAYFAQCLAHYDVIT